MKSLSLALKLWALVGVFVVGMTVVAVSGFWVASQQAAHMSKMTNGNVPRLELVATIGVEARSMRSRQFQYLAAHKPERREELLGQMGESVQKADDAIAAYKKLARDPADIKRIDLLAAQWEEYVDKSVALDEITKTQGDEVGFTYLDKEMRPLLMKQFLPTLEEIGEWNSKDAAQMGKAGDQLRKTGAMLMLALLIGCAIIGIVVALITVKGILKSSRALLAGVAHMRDHQMRDLTSAMEALANADLTRDISVEVEHVAIHSKDELGKISESLNSLQVQVAASLSSYNSARISLDQLVSSVRSYADQVTQSSVMLAESTVQSGVSATEIARGSDSLARSAAEASSAMERFRGAIDEIDSGSREQNASVELADRNLEAAKMAINAAAGAADQMAEIARKGGQAVNETVLTMDSIRNQVASTAAQVRELDHKGHLIGQIVTTIQDIAEQTNLLALNAAIEAARAGESGRGFAVVADEVRKLAEQSGQATREIANLIESVKATVSATVTAIQDAETRVVAGTEQSQAAGSALNEIVGSASAVASELSQVTGSAEDLAQTMAEVREATDRTAELTRIVSGECSNILEAIAGVAAVSEQTAAGAEEMSASTEEVSASANELSSLAAQLKETVSAFQIEEGGKIIRLAA